MLPGKCITTMATQDADVHNILSEIASEGKRLADKEPGSREKLISQARNLITSLEAPWETLLWHLWAEVSTSILLCNRMMA
jgi:hypothetical protein